MRIEIKADFDSHNMEVFHTDSELNNEVPTLIVLDGKEYEGYVYFKRCDNSVEIVIVSEEIEWPL